MLVVPHVCLFSLAVPQMQQLNVQIKNGTKYSLHFASSNEQQDKQLTKDNKGKDHWGQRERGSGGCSKCSSNDSVNCLHFHNSGRVWVSGFASALKFKVANWMNNEISPSQPQPQLHVHPSILPSVRLSIFQVKSQLSQLPFELLLLLIKMMMTMCLIATPSPLPAPSSLFLRLSA